MKYKNFKIMLIQTIISCLYITTCFLTAYAQQDENDWWNEVYPVPLTLDDTTLTMSFVKVDGNKFVNEADETVIFKGLSISDPDKIEKNGHWSKKHFEEIKKWGANLIRIPVHPVAVHQRGLRNYIKLLDDAINWCSELEIYIIIDWHSIGNLNKEVFQAEMYNTTRKETLNFWKTIAHRYQNIPVVAFYEVYNEPTVYNGKFGKCTWEEWKSTVEEIIDIIYAYDKSVIPLVSGFNWAYDLRPIKIAPIDRPNVAYVTHPYPGKCKPPREPQWEETFGFVTDKYPVIATEIGFMESGEDKNLLETGEYSTRIVNYFNKKGISWVVWVFDPDWIPQLIDNWDYRPTIQGEFFKTVMQGKFKYE